MAKVIFPWRKQWPFKMRVLCKTHNSPEKKWDKKQHWVISLLGSWWSQQAWEAFLGFVRWAKQAVCLNALCPVQLDANWYNCGLNTALITTFELTQSGVRSELISSLSFWSCWKKETENWPTSASPVDWKLQTQPLVAFHVDSCFFLLRGAAKHKTVASLWPKEEEWTSCLCFYSSSLILSHVVSRS